MQHTKTLRNRDEKAWCLVVEQRPQEWDVELAEMKNAILRCPNLQDVQKLYELISCFVPADRSERRKHFNGSRSMANPMTKLAHR